VDRAKVAELSEERIDWRFKGLPQTAWGRTVAEYLADGPVLDDLGTPLLTLDRGALDHNLRTMADWCAKAGVWLAPHGKTTMAPALWQAQLDAGAWAITVANLFQLQVARAYRVGRLVLANPLLDSDGLAWLARELDGDPEFSFTCWVDSVAAVEQMDRALRAAGGQRPVDVLVELGGPGGRTGARDLETAVAVGRAVAAAPTLRLTGLGGYEGVLVHGAEPDELAAVERYLLQVLELHTRLRDEHLLDRADPVLISVGGSIYFDQVVRLLGDVPGTRLVLRSGAYLIQDDIRYHDLSPFFRDAGATPLRAAMHGWARALSRPEPDLVLLDGGKRDFPFDEGFPVVQRTRAGRPLTGTVTGFSDQHAYLRGSDARIGEVVRLGLSHPCTALDRWTLIPVLDDADRPDPRVVDLVRTFF
jgi:D-serine deaminase-like pyridoxal phosphate-dependent protein